MRLALLTGLAAPGLFVSQAAHARNTELSVCVDVVVQRSQAKKDAARAGESLWADSLKATQSIRGRYSGWAWASE